MTHMSLLLPWIARAVHAAVLTLASCVLPASVRFSLWHCRHSADVLPVTRSISADFFESLCGLWQEAQATFPFTERCPASSNSGNAASVGRVVAFGCGPIGWLNAGAG